MKLTRQEALEVLDGDSDRYKIIQDEITGNGRWSIDHCLVIYDPIEDKYYISHYSVGATEQQDAGPWEYKKEVEFKEAEIYAETVKKYRVKS